MTSTRIVDRVVEIIEPEIEAALDLEIIWDVGLTTIPMQAPDGNMGLNAALAIVMGIPSIVIGERISVLAAVQNPTKLDEDGLRSVANALIEQLRTQYEIKKNEVNPLTQPNVPIG